MPTLKWWMMIRNSRMTVGQEPRAPAYPAGSGEWLAGSQGSCPTTALQDYVVIVRQKAYGGLDG